MINADDGDVPWSKSLTNCASAREELFEWFKVDRSLSYYAGPWVDDLHLDVDILAYRR